MTYRKHIAEVLHSPQFLEGLTVMSKNIFNLKLEYFFRDQLVIGLNKVLGENFRVIPEYPRDKGKRVDLSICKQVDDKYKLDKMIELKFQFSGDFNCFRDYEGVFIGDFLTKKISYLDNEGPDYFVLIVADWENALEARTQLDVQFDPPVNGLNHFQNSSKKQEKFEHWNHNLMTLFSKHKMDVAKGVIDVNGYVPTNYYYYIVQRKSMAV